MSHAYTINCGGRLLDLTQPRVMGIVNVTPDSFYGGSRATDDDKLRRRVRRLVDEGAAVIDIGGYSTRPGHEPVSIAEETARLRRALAVVTAVAGDVPLSIDTFRPEVMRMAYEEYGATIINDISGGNEAMFTLAGRYRLPYVLMSQAADIETMTATFARDIQRLTAAGATDIIIDPGFGFGKTMEQNYRVLARLSWLEVLRRPLLVGVSRKSMVWRPLGIEPDAALNGTTALHTAALMLTDVALLRVHDVRAARQAITIAGLARAGAHTQEGESC